MTEHHIPEQSSPPEQKPPASPLMDNSASLLRRLGAAMLDGFFLASALMMVLQQTGVMAMFEEFMKLPLEQQMHHEIMTWTFQFKMALGQFVIFTILHGYFLSRFGQTIGKYLLGISIVTLDGQKPEFLPLLLNRYLSQSLMGLIPSLGFWLRLVDIVMIFRQDRRCLHDHIARTRVIDLRVPVGPTNSLIV